MALAIRAAFPRLLLGHQTHQMTPYDKFGRMRLAVYPEVRLTFRGGDSKRMPSTHASDWQHGTLIASPA